MEKPISKLKITLAIFILIAAIAFIYERNRGEPYSQKTLESFAVCLTERGLTMYGAYWCPHCQREKKAFGDAFRLVNYVECTKETALCTEKKVLGFPTWIFADGRRLEGEQGLTKLSEAAGCPLAATSTVGR
jgi:glutaredoxin